MEDLIELLGLLKSHDVRFLVIGAHALAFHGYVRATKDVDIWVERDFENSSKLATALAEFGAEIGENGARRFSQATNEMIRLGVPPNMVDILNFAGSNDFEEVWIGRVEGLLWGVSVHFPSKTALIEMKRVAGRPQDLLDIQKLTSD
jgi:hypothetical protein